MLSVHSSKTDLQLVVLHRCISIEWKTQRVVRRVQQVLQVVAKGRIRYDRAGLACWTSRTNESTFQTFVSTQEVTKKTAQPTTENGVTTTTPTSHKCSRERRRRDHGTTMPRRILSFHPTNQMRKRLDGNWKHVEPFCQLCYGEWYDQNAKVGEEITETHPSKRSLVDCLRTAKNPEDATKALSAINTGSDERKG